MGLCESCLDPEDDEIDLRPDEIETGWVNPGNTLEIKSRISRLNPPPNSVEHDKDSFFCYMCLKQFPEKYQLIQHNLSHINMFKKNCYKINCRNNLQASQTNNPDRGYLTYPIFDLNAVYLKLIMALNLNGEFQYYAKSKMMSMPHLRFPEYAELLKQNDQCSYVVVIVQKIHGLSDEIIEIYELKKSHQSSPVLNEQPQTSLSVANKTPRHTNSQNRNDRPINWQEKNEKLVNAGGTSSVRSNIGEPSTIKRIKSSENVSNAQSNRTSRSAERSNSCDRNKKDRCNSNTRLKTNPYMIQFQQNLPMNELHDLVKNKFTIDHNMTGVHETLANFVNQMDQLNSENYFDNFKLLLHLEECQNSEDLAKYNSDNVSVSVFDKKYLMVTSNDTKQLNNIDEGVIVHLDSTVRRIAGLVDRSVKNSVVIKPFRNNNKDFSVALDEDEKFSVKFSYNRYNYQAEHHALQTFKTNRLIDYLFLSPTNVKATEIKENINVFVNKAINQNPEQKQATEMIVNRVSYPAPYILFGPPGTGKTMTIIEAVLQIYQTRVAANKQTRILLSAQANSACDYMAERLLGSVKKTDMLRYYAESAIVHPSLTEIANILPDCPTKPCRKDRDELLNYPIIITSISNSGRLIQNCVPFGHFDYVFIDECGSARETACLLPMIAAGTSHRTLAAQVVLAGDPFQLGPVVFSKQAKEKGLGLSLLERLMQRELYSRNKITGQYDGRYITKLCNNFRSHPAIIRISNQFFYDDEIQIFGSVEKTNRFLKHPLLLNKDFPIIFHSVTGQMQQDDDLKSFSNPKEILSVMHFVKQLMQHKVKQTDIGIISPYKNQVSKIRTACVQNSFEQIDVGTVEQFQGEEKPVIIISTVRSNTKSMGFLDEPKRFNVAVTRAQSLLIIVGNIVTLKQSDYWQTMFNYCWLNRACSGPWTGKTTQKKKKLKLV